jgi:diguanylate cyclase (GGDEF)-like protein
VTDDRPGEQPSDRRSWHVSRWGLWSLPRNALLYVLAVDLLAVLAGLVVALRGPTPSARDLVNAGVLLLAATAHMLISRRIEESRSDHSTGPHVTTTVVWMFPGAVLLVPVLTFALLVWIRVLWYPISRRPLYRHTFSSAEVVLSVFAALLVLRSGNIDQNTLMSGASATQVLILLGAAVAYFITQALIVGIVIVLSTPKPSWSAVVGSPSDNAFAALALCMAVVVTLATVQSWLALLVLVPVVCAADWAARQVEELRGDSRTDHTTALLNSRGWHEQAARELARVRRQGGPLTVAVLDLDHFKSVNDTWGHPAGDVVLRRVAAVLNERTRQGDVVGRIGGEEFALLLPDTDAAQALVVAERIRTGIAEMTVAATDKRGQPVKIEGRTTSVGIATSGSNGQVELTALLHAADAALYEAKVGGRNQVKVSRRANAHRPAGEAHMVTRWPV